MQRNSHKKTRWESSPPCDQFLKGFAVMGALTALATAIAQSIWPLAFFMAALAWILASLWLSDYLWYQKLVALVLRAQVVELLDHVNERSYTIVYAHKDAEQRWIAPVHWFTQVGEVILNPDGSVDEHSESFFMKYWRPMDPELRMAQVLSYGIPKGFEDRE